MRFLFIIALIVGFQITLLAQRGPGTLYGKDHAFTLTAPEGWVLDNKAAAGSGIHAVFYPEGESWANGMTVMYVNTSGYLPGQNLDSIINYDLGRFIKAKPDIDIRIKPNYALPKNKTAQIRHIYGDDQGNHEAIAYIAEPKTAVIIVMTSKFKPDFEENLPKFNELLNSYDFITEDNDAIQKMVDEWNKK